MGYSHYYYHTRPLPDDEWALVTEAINKIVADAIRSGVSIGDGFGERVLSNHQILAQAWIETQYAHGPAIMLNGAGDTACETFDFWKNATPRQPWQIEENSFNGFTAVKTQRHPYDTVITTFLSWLNAALPHALDKIESDGTDQDWSEGVENAKRLFPDLTITIPITRFS